MKPAPPAGRGRPPKAMVLCAGLGTRLRPLTERWPKPALPLLGAPLFRYTLATLKRVGVTSVGINTHHLPEVMTAVAAAECDRASVRLERSHEAAALEGTGGGIRGLRRFLEGDDFLVVNGDVLFAVELQPIIDAHRASRAAATLVVLPMPEGERFNSVDADPSGRVRRLAGVGPGGAGLTPWHFTGVHLMSPAVFDFMAPEGPLDINRDVYPAMVVAGLEVRVHALEPDEVYWSDLGTPARYLRTHRALLAGEVPTERFGEADPFALPGVASTGPSRSRIWADPTAVRAEAGVVGPVWLGAGAEVGERAALGPAVSLGPRARVGAGAKLVDVAVLDGAEVPPGRALNGAVVAPGGVVVGPGGADQLL